MATSDDTPPLDPHPCSAWVARSGRRNRDAVLEALVARLPGAGRVLELGSGSGMHIHYFAPHLPGLILQPSDRTATHFDVLRRRTREEGLENVAPPIVLDLVDPATWPPASTRYRAMFCINVLHVAPPAAVDGIARCAATYLERGGALLVYGAFTVDGRYTTGRSEELDRAFQAQGDPDWGYRDTRDVITACEGHGLVARGVAPMPEGRLLVEFARP